MFKVPHFDAFPFIPIKSEDILRTRCKGNLGKSWESFRPNVTTWSTCGNTTPSCLCVQSSPSGALPHQHSSPSCVHPILSVGGHTTPGNMCNLTHVFMASCCHRWPSDHCCVLQDDCAVWQEGVMLSCLRACCVHSHKIQLLFWERGECTSCHIAPDFSQKRKFGSYDFQALKGSLLNLLHNRLRYVFLLKSRLGDLIVQCFVWSIFTVKMKSLKLPTFPRPVAPSFGTGSRCRPVHLKVRTVNNSFHHGAKEHTFKFFGTKHVQILTCKNICDTFRLECKMKCASLWDKGFYRAGY